MHPQINATTKHCMSRMSVCSSRKQSHSPGATLVPLQAQPVRVAQRQAWVTAAVAAKIILLFNS